METLQVFSKRPFILMVSKEGYTTYSQEMSIINDTNVNVVLDPAHIGIRYEQIGSTTNANNYIYRTSNVYSTVSTVYSQQSATTAVVGQCAYGNGIYVVSILNGGILYSTNGTTWTSGSYTIPEASHFMYKIIFNGTAFYGLSYYGKYLYYSTNGINWSYKTTPMTVNAANTFFGYANGKLIISTVRTNTTEVFISSDFGDTWTAANITPFGKQLYPTDFCYGNNKYILMEREGLTHISSDGINWTQSTEDVGYLVMYGNNKFISCLHISPYTVKYSSDGIHWTNTSYNLPSAPFVFKYLSNKFVIDGKYISTDGINWTDTGNSIMRDLA